MNIHNFLLLSALIPLLYLASDAQAVGPCATVTVAPPPSSPVTIGWNPATTPTADDGGANLDVLIANGNTGTGSNLPSTAAIQSISIWVRSGSGNAILAIYDNTGTGNGPGALKAQTASTAVSPVSGGQWYTINTTTNPSLSSGNYWLVFITDSNSPAFGIDTSTPVNGTQYITGQPYSMPSTFPGGRTNQTGQYALYATLQ